MAWIEYNNTYDMMLHCCILECLDSLGILNKIRTLLENTMRSWRVKLTYGVESLMLMLSSLPSPRCYTWLIYLLVAFNVFVVVIALLNDQSKKT